MGYAMTTVTGRKGSLSGPARPVMRKTGVFGGQGEHWHLTRDKRGHFRSTARENPMQRVWWIAGLGVAAAAAIGVTAWALSKPAAAAQPTPKQNPTGYSFTQGHRYRVTITAPVPLPPTAVPTVGQAQAQINQALGSASIAKIVAVSQLGPNALVVVGDYLGPTKAYQFGSTPAPVGGAGFTIDDLGPTPSDKLTPKDAGNSLLAALSNVDYCSGLGAAAASGAIIAFQLTAGVDTHGRLGWYDSVTRDALATALGVSTASVPPPCTALPPI